MDSCTILAPPSVQARWKILSPLRYEFRSVLDSDLASVVNYTSDFICVPASFKARKIVQRTWYYLIFILIVKKKKTRVKLVKSFDLFSCFIKNFQNLRSDEMYCN